MDCKKVFNFLVDELEKYLKENNLKSMILGISGGIDSTIVAAICHEVSKRTGIPLIGRSLPTKFNKRGEITTADLVGNAFCTDFQTFNIGNMYENVLDELIETSEEQTPIANGNIQARLRMIYLYNLASIHKGMVMDTDNLTENNLGYYTLHGDQGDYNPIHCLWKTEVFELAKYLADYYKNISYVHSNTELILENLNKSEAITESLKLQPTAGLGITDSDLDEIGANSYEEIDNTLKVFIEDKDDNSIRMSILREKYGEDIVNNVIRRHKASEFKRNRLPVYPIIEDKD
jgi:NAD+ synthetase